MDLRLRLRTFVAANTLKTNLNHFFMKPFYLAALFLSASLCVGTSTAEAQNIIPRPRTYTTQENGGTFTFKNETQVACLNLPDSLKAEAQRFIDAFEAASGIELTASNTAPSGIILEQTADQQLGPEGYALDVTSESITLRAQTAAGFFHAFQTLKMLLPRNVMAEVADPTVTEYAIPACSITDSPRFEYRGFMLDCARHFFTIDEIKRVLDIMAYYKMNRFQWHLTDDQGWRFEMPKYPKLQTIAATRQGSWDVDPAHGRFYTSDQYGPYYYTVEQMKEIVAYAAERHIEVIPEIEMPGHMCAAITAYPEFSCNPYGSHRVWNDGGVSTDVLNIANPAAVQFCKDILDELTEIFPSKYIHIGGDECPTNAWSSNADCLALQDSLGYDNIRGLQSHFTHDLIQYMASKEDPEKRRHLIAWNESVTAQGSDLDLLRGEDLTIMCWTGAENASNVAQNLGMATILTPQPQWYINRKQSPRPDEVHNAGSGSDATLEIVYNHRPTIRTNTLGVQGTFWCEHVSSNWLLEYQALPRLIAMAEVGWTQDNLRDFDNFLTRLRVDTTLLNYRDYVWCDYLVRQEQGETEEPQLPEEGTYYRLTTRATDTRSGRAIELVCKDSPLVTDKATQATVGYLWSNTPITDATDTIQKYQYWTFVADPAGSGKYALVNKAWPDGSVNPTATNTELSGRWMYDYTARHYNFSLGAGGNSGNDDGISWFDISSDQHAGLYFNSAGSGQKLAINIYSKPYETSAGLFNLEPEGSSDIDYVTIPSGTATYRIENISPYQAGVRLADNEGSTLGWTTSAWGNDAWTVNASEPANGVQTITLTNTTTGRSIAGTTSPVSLGDTPAEITLTSDMENGGFTLSAAEGAKFYPIGDGYSIDPGTIYADASATFPQGTNWRLTEVVRAVYTARDTEGKLIGTYICSIEKGKPYTPSVPEIANYECTTDPATLTGTDDAQTDLTYELTYRRTAYTASLRSLDPNGILIAQKDSVVPADKAASFSWTAPDMGEYYTYASSETSDVLTLESDSIIDLIYQTDALPSFAEALEPATEVEDGHYYLLFDNSNVESGQRSGFLSVNPTNNRVVTSYTIEGTPAHVWKAVKNGEGFKLQNSNGLYIPKLVRSGQIIVSENGDTFTFTRDGENWSILGTNGLYFNGVVGGLTGWEGPHPYKLYTFRTKPYYAITYTTRRTADNLHYYDVELGTYTFYAEAGAEYTLDCPVEAPRGYEYVVCSTDETTGIMTGNLDVTYTFMSRRAVGIDEIKNDKADDDHAWYDLTGRRVSQPAKGIYIHGGNKVLVP